MYTVGTRRPCLYPKYTFSGCMNKTVNTDRLLNDIHTSMKTQLGTLQLSDFFTDCIFFHQRGVDINSNVATRYLYAYAGFTTKVLAWNIYKKLAILQYPIMLLYSKTEKRRNLEQTSFGFVLNRIPPSN
jgi:hypothetical protein